MRHITFERPYRFVVQFRDNINRGIMEHLYAEIFTTDSYAIPQCKVEPGDTVVDAGGYVGLFSISAIFKGAAKIIAFEPSRIIYPYLRINATEAVKQWPRAVQWRGYECALWDSDHSRRGNRLNFRPSGGSPGARIGPRKPGSTSFVYAVTLDSLHLEKVDFIKMDIEGSEIPALRGAVKTIKRCRPKLAISLYHRKEDIEEIPALIKSFGMGYKQQITDGFIDKKGFKFMNGFWW